MGVGKIMVLFIITLYCQLPVGQLFIYSVFCNLKGFFSIVEPLFLCSIANQILYGIH